MLSYLKMLYHLVLDLINANVIDMIIRYLFPAILVSSMVTFICAQFIKKRKHLNYAIWLLSFSVFFVFSITVFSRHNITTEQIGIIDDFKTFFTGYWYLYAFSNVVLFVPIGLFLAKVFKINTVYKYAICGFSLSLLIEMIQFMFHRGVFQVTDIILNTLGAIIGGLIASKIHLKTKENKFMIKWLILAFALLLILAYIPPVVSAREVNGGNLFGFSCAGLLIIYVILFDKVNAIISNVYNNSSGKIVLIGFGIVICLCISFFSIVFVGVASHMDADNVQSNTVIVLGCKVYGDKPGIFLNARINAAYDYLEKNENAIAVLSGGQGPGEKISEAQCMYNELIEKGIDENRLLLESQSTSTLENFKFSKKILEENNMEYDGVTVVTNDFHEYRASKLAKKYGFKTFGYPSKTSRVGVLTFITRETFAVIAQVIL